MRYKVAVSVIMPCYNAQDYIYEAIDSIVGQSFEDWELIIVDDASTDRTVEIVRSFVDRRIQLHCLDKNRGNYGARNYGLNQACGKYIAMFDADDISLPDRLSIQYSYMEKHKDVGAIGCNYDLIDREGKERSTMRRACTYRQFKIKLLSDNYMLQSTIFVRHHYLKKFKIRYDESFKYASDYHFVFQCSCYFKIFNIAERLLQYRLNPKSITKTKFLEQQMYASKIRLAIFRYYFDKVLSQSDLEIIDKVFHKHHRQTHISVDIIQNVFNKLLVYNYEKENFDKKELYDLFYKTSIEYLIRGKNEAMP